VTRRERRVPPILVALLIQVIAVSLALAARTVLASRELHMGLVATAGIVGLFAAVLTTVARLDRWWIVLQALFAPALLSAVMVNIPRWIVLAVLALLVLTYWSTFRTQVPLYLSSTAARQAVVQWLPTGPFRFLDVGSGVGGVLMDLSRVRSDGTYVGIESAPVPWAISRVRILLGRYPTCHARWGSFWTCDLAEFDVVFAYLSPVPMAALWEKVQQEMRPGSRFISNTFPVAGRAPDATLTVDDLHRSTLYLWRM
jgi:hypothetical protein